ncbi:MAG: phosphatidylinositol-specific phospholipase C1-like protein [Pseudomonadales bacterium]|nr:phosphatidylinositol-specific phospholipase C1-like protein [Pseudomonadales bacterium]
MKKTNIKLLLLLFVLGSLAGCQQTGSVLKLNEVQFLGSHNSYKKAIDPALLQMLAANDPRTAAGLDYSHRPLTEQLNLGMRKLELDVFYDPEGGRYANPVGLVAIPDPLPWAAELVQKPGFKVFHVQDIDFRSHCVVFATCLQQLADWSDAHPAHFPVFILINAKTDKIPRPDFVEPLPFDAAAWNALDLELRSGLKQKLFTPDELRGDYATLREAVMAGWPALDAMRGRILVVLDDSAEKKAFYAQGHPSLRDRAMFTDAPADSDEAAIMVINEPLRDGARITEMVRQGFIVRTRADADTSEARTGNTDRREAAFNSGAQIIATDYYLPDDRFESGYKVELPEGGIARCNPVLISTPCVISQ